MRGMMGRLAKAGMAAAGKIEGRFPGSVMGAAGGRGHMLSIAMSDKYNMVNRVVQSNINNTARTMRGSRPNLRGTNKNPISTNVEWNSTVGGTTPGTQPMSAMAEYNPTTAANATTAIRPQAPVPVNVEYNPTAVGGGPTLVPPIAGGGGAPRWGGGATARPGAPAVAANRGLSSMGGMAGMGGMALAGGAVGGGTSYMTGGSAMQGAAAGAIVGGGMGAGAGMMGARLATGSLALGQTAARGRMSGAALAMGRGMQTTGGAQATMAAGALGGGFIFGGSRRSKKRGFNARRGNSF